jgi:hypothetical protein
MPRLTSFAVAWFVGLALVALLIQDWPLALVLIPLTLVVFYNISRRADVVLRALLIVAQLGAARLWLADWRWRPGNSFLRSR